MNRRTFIKITGLSAGAVVLGSSITSCDNHSEVDHYGWNGPAPHESDIRVKVLAYAMLCPNPHNKQAWRIHFTGPTSFDLYVDSERLLPETDPYHRQIHIGQGTFLETLAIASSGLGYEAKIDYFPHGMYSNVELLNKPVASINLVTNGDLKADTLFTHLLQRRSNKREYDGVGLNTQQKDQLLGFHKRHGQLSFVDKAPKRAHMERILTQAMQIEVSNRQRDMETIKMFRFNDDEVAKYRDGFGVSQNGITGFIELTKKTAESTRTFGMLVSESNSRLDQVKVGRDYCRIDLQVAAMGLAIHPMSQVLQEYKDMLALQSEFKNTFKFSSNETVQMLFRLGYAKPTPHSPRRLVSQIIKT